MNLNKENDLHLGRLQVGDRFVVDKISPKSVDSAFLQRLLEIGFFQGQVGTVVGQAPVFQDPILVEIQGSIFGLRRKEASCVGVQLIGGSK